MCTPGFPAVLFVSIENHLSLSSALVIAPLITYLQKDASCVCTSPPPGPSQSRDPSSTLCAANCLPHLARVSATVRVPALRNQRVTLVSPFNLAPARSEEEGLSPSTFFFNCTLCRLHHKRPRTPCSPPHDAAPGAHDLGAPACLGSSKSLSPISFHSLIFFLEGTSKSYPLLVQGSQRLRLNTAELSAFRLGN